MSDRTIYFDHAATTPVRKKYWRQCFRILAGNSETFIDIFPWQESKKR